MRAGRRQPSAFEVRLYVEEGERTAKVANDPERTGHIQDIRDLAPALHRDDVATVAALTELLYIARSLPLRGRVTPAGEEALKQIEALRERIRRLADVVDDVHRGSR